MGEATSKENKILYISYIKNKSLYKKEILSKPKNHNSYYSSNFLITFQQRLVTHAFFAIMRNKEDSSFSSLKLYRIHIKILVRLV